MQAVETSDWQPRAKGKTWGAVPLHKWAHDETVLIMAPTALPVTIWTPDSAALGIVFQGPIRPAACRRIHPNLRFGTEDMWWGSAKIDGKAHSELLDLEVYDKLKKHVS
jgi:energy-coupling factor transporter ATP-binding protein EcfA2